MGKKKRRGKRSPELTDDLITDIISRVSDKDLMRFMCVSKSWRYLIYTDSYFSRLRSRRTALRDRPFLIIQKGERGRLYSTSNYWVELDSIEDGNPKLRQVHNPFDDDNDDCPRRDACVIGSCDGLLVLRQLYTRKMAVVNPTTKKHHVVPPNPAGADKVRFIGFGYDHVHGCYKLVTENKHASGGDHVAELMTYDVTNRAWKKSRFDGLDDDCRSLLRYSGKSVDGALYWFDEMKMRNILSFLLAEEEFHEVDPPYYDDSVVFSVTVFDGRLCFVGCRDPPDDTIEFWLMELGSSHSPLWIKFLLISDLEAIIPCPFNLIPDLIPICYSACENKMLFVKDCYQLFWYDIGENIFSKLKSPINELGYGWDVHVIVPSLVGIGSS